MNIIVIGAGLTGATVARLFADAGHKVEVYEKRNHIGGNCYDYKMGKAFISVYGPHIFHTNESKVWSFVNRFANFNNYKHEVCTYHNKDFYDWPINLKTIKKIFGDREIDELRILIANEILQNDERINANEYTNFEEKAISMVGVTLYKHFIENYTEKMWGIKPNELSVDLCNRIPIKWTEDNIFFSDKYQGLPKCGYFSMISEMMNHKNIKIYLNMNIESYDYSFVNSCDIFVTTANLNIAAPKLIYREMSFLRLQADCDNPTPVVNFSDNYTQKIRKTDYGKMWNDESNRRISVIEIPGKFTEVERNISVEPLALCVEAYPIPNKSMQEYANNTIQTMKRCNINSLGRLGSYKYLNMDQAILQAMNFVEGVL